MPFDHFGQKHSTGSCQIGQKSGFHRKYIKNLQKPYPFEFGGGWGLLVFHKYFLVILNHWRWYMVTEYNKLLYQSSSWKRCGSHRTVQSGTSWVAPYSERPSSARTFRVSWRPGPNPLWLAGTPSVTRYGFEIYKSFYNRGMKEFMFFVVKLCIHVAKKVFMCYTYPINEHLSCNIPNESTTYLNQTSHVVCMNIFMLSPFYESWILLFSSPSLVPCLRC